MRHRHHHHRRHGPRSWLQLKRIHHRLVGVLLGAVAIGAAGGYAIQVVHATGSWIGTGCVLLGVWLTVGPLGWLATLRIAKPVEDLARVAGQLQEGHLDRRSQLVVGRDGEVGEVAGALRGMADRLVEQLRAQRALMAAVSHELRSPLGRVRVLTELLREGSAPPTAYDDLQREIDGMDALVGDLLAGARIDFEAVAPRELEVVDLAGRALALAELPAEALVVNGEAGAVQADPTLLVRALSGLLDNARRYGGQHVQLRVDDLGDRVQFTVEDDGPGFAPGDEVRAFEPFWRGPVPPDGVQPKGEGLGLALVRQIARAHGGDAGARNRPDRGARVWVVMPRSASATASRSR